MNKLWEYFTMYYYLPRLNNKKVLLEAIQQGIEARTFALADYENFNGLKFGERISLDELSGKILVKAEVAEKIFTPTETVESVASAEPEEIETPAPEKPKFEPLPKKFFMNTDLNTDRLNKHFNDCISEVAAHIKNLPNAKISVHIAINITAPDGIPKDIQESVKANCGDLGVSNPVFEKYQKARIVEI